MPRRARYATVPLYWLTVAVCVAVLFVSLVMWPRSYLHRDMWWLDDPIPADVWPHAREAAPLQASPQSVLNSEIASPIRRNGAAWLTYKGALIIREPLYVFSRGEWRVGTEWWPRRSRWILYSHALSSPNKRRSLVFLVVPFWLSISTSLVALSLLVARRRVFSGRRRLARFRVADVLTLMAGVAIPIAAYKVHADAGSVMAGEAILLALISRWAYSRARASSGARRYGWATVVAGCGVGVVALGAFFVYCLARFGPS